MCRNKDKHGVQALIRKGLIVTLVKNKNGGLIHNKRTRHHSYNERDLFLDGKLKLNKTQTLIWQLLLSLYQRGNILGLRATSWHVLNLGLRPDTM
jgi:hypothetical protein